MLRLVWLGALVVILLSLQIQGACLEHGCDIFLQSCIMGCSLKQQNCKLEVDVEVAERRMEDLSTDEDATLVIESAMEANVCLAKEHECKASCSSKSKVFGTCQVHHSMIFLCLFGVAVSFYLGFLFISWMIKWMKSVWNCILVRRSSKNDEEHIGIRGYMTRTLDFFLNIFRNN